MTNIVRPAAIVPGAESFDPSEPAALAGIAAYRRLGPEHRLADIRLMDGRRARALLRSRFGRPVVERIAILRSPGPEAIHALGASLAGGRLPHPSGSEPHTIRLPDLGRILEPYERQLMGSFADTPMHLDIEAWPLLFASMWNEGLAHIDWDRHRPSATVTLCSPLHVTTLEIAFGMIRVTPGKDVVVLTDDVRPRHTRTRHLEEPSDPLLRTFNHLPRVQGHRRDHRPNRAARRAVRRLLALQHDTIRLAVQKEFQSSQDPIETDARIMEAA